VKGVFAVLVIILTFRNRTLNEIFQSNLDEKFSTRL